MAKQYKTPGVYVVEKNSFGSSIVANETAIPVFIGFTEYYLNSKGDELNKVKESDFVREPLLVRSMLEYQNAFGGPDETGDIYVKAGLDKDGKVVYTAVNKKNTNGVVELYDPGLMQPSVSNFFSNGGGSCYIISLGKYDNFKTDVVAGTITGEMQFIEQAIEMAETTTLIVPTDLIRYGTTNYYNWGTQFTNFAQQEKKYFTVLDVIQKAPNSPVYDTEDIANYRNAVTPEFPSYAGAYFPYLKSLTTYAYKSDLSNVYLEDRPVPLGPLGENNYSASAKVEVASTPTEIFTATYKSATLFPEIEYVEVPAAADPTDPKPVPSIVVKENKLTVNFVADTSVLDMNTMWKAQASKSPNWGLEFKAATPTGAAVVVYTQLAVWKNALAQKKFPFIATCTSLILDGAPYAKMTANVVIGDPVSVEIAANVLTITVKAGSSPKQAAEAINALVPPVKNVKIEVNPLFEAATIKGDETIELPIYNPSNAIIEDVKNFLATNYINMPPSPFMAGIYSRLDNATGVWTPPANVSPTGVTGPVVPLTNKQQEDLNVDATAGKSINAIRTFTGKGTLVWGARTNDGNSMDWRYVNVRRLFISMETDISKALEAYVFKPNVHNTWVEVKTNIESYLFGLFGQGAFAGTVPETSYQVLIGVGETMTDEDVLNGYMRVSIMVAPVRPAEFIVLTFSQMIGQ